MKKFFFSALIMGLVCLMAAFTGCQSEESDFEPTNKIEMLKAKSKELAKKYHVNVTLNDDSIAKYADQMTVESMEEDYKMFAEMKKTLQNGDGQTKTIAQNKPLSRKAFLKRRKSETETEKPALTYEKGDFGYTCKSSIKCPNNLCNGGNLTINSHFYWDYSPRTKSISCHVEMSATCNDSSCMYHKCGGCGSATELVGLTTTGHNFNGAIEFTAIGTACLRLCSYNVFIGVHVTYSDSGHQVVFS